VRRRLVISTIAIVMVVLGAMAVPVGLIVRNSAQEQLEARLQQQASVIAATVTAQLATGPTLRHDELEQLLADGDGLLVLNPDGTVALDLRERGVDTTRTARAVASGGQQIIVETDADPLDADVRQQLQILLVLALGGIGAAAGLAAVQGHQLGRPLELLARRAGRIGEGDFSRLEPVRTQIPEIDKIGDALDLSASRVDALLASERHFTADATHQLRTGIAGMSLRAEILSLHPDPEVAAEAQTMLEQADQLNRTIDDLLLAARNRESSERGEFDLVQIAETHAREWAPRYQQVKRRLSVIVTAPPPPVLATKGLVGQVLDVLIDNALVHGDGAVTLMIDGPTVTVIDQGRGISPERVASLFDGPVDPAARHGRGLPLARRLAQVDGGKLEVVRAKPLSIKLTLVPYDGEPDGRATNRSER
jgi:signal transduction histidine kinase